MMPCRLCTEFSEEHAASVSGLMMKTARSSEMSIREDGNPSHHTETSNFK